MRLYRTQQLIRPDLQAHLFSQALLDNVAALKSLCSQKTKFCAVVKANAYGHGISETVNILKKSNVDFFAVASTYEAIHIDNLIQTQAVLILEPINSSQPVNHINLCAKKQWHCVISSLQAFDFISNILTKTKLTLNLHINIETGMGRLGLETDQAQKLIKLIDQCKNTNLAGVFTHFATADEQDLSYAYEQLDKFNVFLADSSLASRKDVIIHAANSAATIKMPQAHFDMVRCGISMYGYYSRRMDNPPITLKPVMKLQAPIIEIKKIPTGESVSYGRSFIAERDTTIAVVPLGYADGYRRCFSNTAKMKIGEHLAPVVGRVCMDQLLIDITDIKDASIGQMVTIIDSDHDSPCGVYALSEIAKTICYEMLTLLHSHVNRIVH